METIQFTNPEPEPENYRSVQSANMPALSEKESPVDSAYHFFLYLLMFFSLFFTTTGVGTILYQLINKAFPDETLTFFSGYQQTAVKYGIASIVIAAPIYFLLAYLIGRYERNEVIASASKVRRWITFLVIFLASATLVGDLISFVYYLLDGELFARFILKVLVVLFIAGSVWTYYFWVMKRKIIGQSSSLVSKVVAGVSSVIILIVFFSSFLVIDSPITTRNKKLDSKLVSALSNYKYAVDDYYRKNKTLPNNLTDFKDSSYLPKRMKIETITYEKSSTTAYKLCADFKTSNLDSRDEEAEEMDLWSYSYNDEDWKHAVGHVCFTKNIQSNDYPAYSNGLRSSFDYDTDLPPAPADQYPDEDMAAEYDNNSGGSAFVMSSPEELAKARERAHLANIKATMSSTVPAAIICQDAGGSVISGNGGDPVCNDKKSDGLLWPEISACGPNAADAQWTVFNGESANWNVTLNCKEKPGCNGPTNAICDGAGCKFAGTCQ